MSGYGGSEHRDISVGKEMGKVAACRRVGKTKW